MSKHVFANELNKIYLDNHHINWIQFSVTLFEKTNNVIKSTKFAL